MALEETCSRRVFGAAIRDERNEIYFYGLAFALALNAVVSVGRRDEPLRMRIPAKLICPAYA